MIGRAGRPHGFRLLLAAALLGLLGWFVGHFTATLLLGALLYLAWQLLNVFRLHRWLESERLEPPESLGIWSEVFDRIHVLQKLNRKQHEQNERTIMEFRSMTDAFPDATLVLDDQDILTWFNQSAQTLLGLRAPDDIGQAVTNLLRDPDFANWIAVEAQVESRFEMTSPLDPMVRLSVSAIRFREDQRLLILRDITDIHNLEQIRRDFVANVSHELRTPLTVLFGYLEALRDQCDEDFEPAVERMLEQASQMQALLNDLLELSRLQTEERDRPNDTINVCAILLQLREQAEEISQGRHDIKVSCQEGLYLRGSEKDLESAFRNLINNAVHYTPAGGSIEISWAAHSDGEMAFQVRDTGIGIPRRDIPRLTERFYRVGSDRSRHTGGTGLGLAIVKHVMNAHDARLQIESELGEGSCFSCVFPAERHVDGGPEAQEVTPAT